MDRSQYKRFRGNKRIGDRHLQELERDETILCALAALSLILLPVALLARFLWRLT
jgi:hypothetical protein